MTTLMFVATSTVSAIAGAAVVIAPAAWMRDAARKDREHADATYDMAEGLAAEVERTRNLPWYWPTDPDVTGEIVAEQVHEPLALSDRPAVDEDEVGDEQPGSTLMRPVLAVARWVGYALALVDTVVEWVRQWAIGVKHDLRERFKSNAQREAEDRVEAEFWARVNQPALTAEPVEAEADEDRWAEDSAITDGPDAAEPVNREPYRGVGRHWADGTAQHKVIGPGRHEKLINVPAQRDGGEN